MFALFYEFPGYPSGYAVFRIFSRIIALFGFPHIDAFRTIPQSDRPRFCKVGNFSVVRAIPNSTLMDNAPIQEKGFY
jgi:hypothetical protein